LTVVLVVDVSASETSKARIETRARAEVACVLAFSAIRNNDKVGLMLCRIASSFSFRPRKAARIRCASIREILFFERRTRTKPALASII